MGYMNERYEHEYGKGLKPVFEGAFLKNLTPETPVPKIIITIQSELTLYDQRMSKKPGYNRYALAHYMGAVQNIKKEVGNRGTKEDLFNAMKKHFAFDRISGKFGLPALNRIALKAGMMSA